ncbi:hypothetical protein NE261_02850 [Enterococcus italicus]|uniref:hypothetical protein n=1 Tax=Enterococcus italicus TaxID=246144 RepID=UPI0020735A3C|nr:hypothetical protein [Enterococcus italicus]MCM6880420.1 hypothetical protein [Enterococcus italicus]MCM6930754.1 hypothetical protein [Enterococcus italicus]
MNLYTIRTKRKKLDQLKRKREQQKQKSVFITDREAQEFDLNSLPSDTVIIIDDILEKENGYDNN